MAQLNYRPDLNREHDVLPSGFYTVIFDKCEVRTFSPGEEYFTFIWRIMEGGHTGKLIADNIYIYASDLKYKEKAKLKLDRLCEIFDISYLDSTDLLINKKCRVHTGIRLTSQGVPLAYIRGYWSLPENQPKLANKQALRS